LTKKANRRFKSGLQRANFFGPKYLKEETLMAKKKLEIVNDTRTQKQLTNCEAQAKIKRLRLDQLRTDGGTHCRTETNAFQVDEYVEAMRRGDKFPPVRARYDEQENCYWLWDGFHRLAAVKEYGAETIEVEVRLGTKRDALLDAIGANADHGLPRTNADKQKAVLELFNDLEWKKWSNREIARYCRVSHTFVAQLRPEPSGFRDQMEVKVERNGKPYTMKTSRIGSTQRIVQAAREILRNTSLADDPKGLKRIATRPPELQVRAAQLIAEGKTNSAETAILKAEQEIRSVQQKEELPDPTMKGKYRTLMVDPPWDLGEGGRFSPSLHYEVMSMDEIRDLPIARLAADDCHLYLWTVQGVLRESLDLLDEWRFTLKSIITWAKVDRQGQPRLGSGYYFRNCTEYILFAVRGNLPAHRNDLPNFFEAERGRHSEKPDAAYELAEQMSATPRFDMFSRTDREGWTAWGKEAGIFGKRDKASDRYPLDRAA
jgi:N6-adenosine-specific RNA methylase IME4